MCNFCISLKIISAPGHRSDKVIKYNIEVMTYEESSKIVNFMTTGAGVFVLGCEIISHSEKL